MATLSYIVWTLTLVGNAILFLLLSWREYYIRYSWLTVSVAISILADITLMTCHSGIHHLYEPLRLFIFYGVFYILDIAIIWEAWCLGDRRIRFPVEMQLGISFAALLAKHAQFLWTAYGIEIFLRWLNLAVTIWFITIFQKENTFEPRTPRAD